MKHTNVALFTVHEGCPHRCSFCNQRHISGSAERLTPADVHRAAAVALNGRQAVPGGEIAFFGGSFTLMEREYMLSLLAAAKEHVDNKEFSGIRISTRPDGISDDICRILKAYGVTAVELGAQSMDDRVLALNGRGHTAARVIEASRMLQAYGFSLGLQMMTGLYGSSDEDSIATAEAIIRLKPATVRIYPTVVMEHTELARLMQSGAYRPQTPEEAAELGSTLLLMFHRASIPVIRFGLHAGGDVEGHYIGGAYHPALRELAESRIYYKAAVAAAADRKGKAVISVAPTAISKMAGQKRENMIKLRQAGIFAALRADPSLGEYEVKLDFE